MGYLTRMIMRLGQEPKKEEIKESMTAGQLLDKQGLSREQNEVLAGDRPLRDNDTIGSAQTIVIAPKQKGGSIMSSDFLDHVSSLLLGHLVDPKGEDKKLWNKIDKAFGG